MAGSFLKPAAALCAALASCQSQYGQVQLPLCHGSGDEQAIVWPASCEHAVFDLDAVHASGALCAVVTGLCGVSDFEPRSSAPRELRASEAEDHKVGSDFWWMNLGAVAALVSVSGLMAGACGK